MIWESFGVFCQSPNLHCYVPSGHFATMSWLLEGGRNKFPSVRFLNLHTVQSLYTLTTIYSLNNLGAVNVHYQWWLISRVRSKEGDQDSFSSHVDDLQSDMAQVKLFILELHMWPKKPWWEEQKFQKLETSTAKCSTLKLPQHGSLGNCPRKREHNARALNWQSHFQVPRRCLHAPDLPHGLIPKQHH